MKSSFQAGVDAIYNAIVGQGVTPAGKTPAQLASAISTVATNKYNAGNSAGYTNGYNAGYAAGGSGGTISYSAVQVAVGQEWAVGIHYGAGGAVGYAGVAGQGGHTCAYDVIADMGDDHGWTDRWWKLVRITGAGVLGNAASVVVRTK